MTLLAFSSALPRSQQGPIGSGLSESKSRRRRQAGQFPHASMRSFLCYFCPAGWQAAWAACFLSVLAPGVQVHAAEGNDRLHPLVPVLNANIATFRIYLVSKKTHLKTPVFFTCKGKMLHRDGSECMEYVS
ncbi:hypothetical protein IRJ41_022384 [Triplophysa rosa]|uniref:Uncharacterized protein n=1 Tax=Triplophysa rosa TaxID=992332 RepID=A0A9W7X162_TRIRA|nr:hypothetical protein IRJ41_022384 [Triplophysa rosa]